MEKEARILKANIGIESRAEGKRYLEYDAIVFNTRSRNVGGFYEIISPTAVRGADFSEWFAKKNHNTNFMLGSSEAGTANYVITDTAVRASVLVGDSTIWADTMKEVERRELNHASFEFTVKEGGDSWERITEDGKVKLVRTVTAIEKIYDMSPVNFPAYKDTMGITVAKRSLDAFLASEKRDGIDGNTETGIEDTAENSTTVIVKNSAGDEWKIEIELLELESVD